jgi:hypothetical protein
MGRSECGGYLQHYAVAGWQKDRTSETTEIPTSHAKLALPENRRLDGRWMRASQTPDNTSSCSYLLRGNGSYSSSSLARSRSATNTLPITVSANHIVATPDDKMLIMIPKITVATAKPARDCNQGERLVERE